MMLRFSNLKLGTKFMISLGFAIALTIGLIFIWFSERQEEQITDEVDKQAKILFKQIVITRQWIADHGGIFVEKMPGIESNPYLVNPDIEDTRGRTYTLRNPALVTRELSEYAEKEGLYKFHITSLKLKNPNNAPDEFEKNALLEFENGRKEISGIEIIDGTKVYRYMAPLYITKACLCCHADQGYTLGDVRGGISVFIPMQGAEAAIAYNRKMLFLAAIGIIAAAEGILYIFTRRFIVRPLHKLQESAGKISTGNYGVQTEVESKDEIGDLAHSFNIMAGKLKESYEKLEEKVEERTKELLFLQKINNMLNAGTTLDDVLKEIVNGLTSVFGYFSSGIHLLNKEGTHLVCKDYSIDSNIAKKIEELTGITALNYKIPLYKGSLLTKIIQTKEPLITSDVVEVVRSHTAEHILQNLAPAIARISGIKYGIGVPLLAGEKVVGIIGIGSKVQLTGEDAERLANFAKQAGLAVEKARLEEELKKYSTQLEQKVRERTREVKETRRYLASIVDGSMDAIVSIDLKGRIKSWNKGAEQVLGYTSEQMIGEHYYKIVPEELRDDN